MSYVGNPSLNEETKARIRTTFDQTVQLAGAGRMQEAVLGCDFILKMDPQFSPAQVLLSRLEGADGAVYVGDLGAQGAEMSAAVSGAAQAATQAATQAAGPEQGSEASPGADGLPPLPTTGLPTGDSSFGDELDLLGSPDPSSVQTDSESPIADVPSLGADLDVGQPALDVAEDALGSSDDGRVQALLDEGQSSFDAGAYQGAIDAWSRIFLIDIDHEEASRRIEEARRLKDESERLVDERFHVAVDHIEAGRLVEGRTQLEEVLAIQPDHLGARERLTALDSAEPSAPSAEGGTESIADEDGHRPSADADSGGLSSASGVVGSVGSLPPGSTGSSAGPYAQPPTVSPPASAKSGGRFADRRFLFIGAGALLVVFGLGSFLYSNWGTLFPNAPADQADFSFKRPDPLAEANRLYVAGDVEGALEVLDRVDEGAPRFARAQEQAEEWRREIRAKEEARAAEQAGAKDRLAQRDSLLESARRLYAEGEFFRAAKDFNSAAKIESLDRPAADMFEDAKRQLLPLQQQITLFREGEWERVQAPLWRLLEADPNNRDARGLLVDSYYNLGVQALRRGNARDAMEPLSEADRLRPSDPMVERLLLLANTYSQLSSADVLYSIFVEELRYRN